MRRMRHTEGAPEEREQTMTARRRTRGVGIHMHGYGWQDNSSEFLEN